MRYKLSLIAVFAAFWIWAAIDPLHPKGWLLENVIVVAFVALLIAGGIYFRLSNLSYTLITGFLILHVIASHYTYSYVPFGYTLGDWFNTDRNMYDRLVHFLFGLLFAYPVREVFIRLAQAKGFWSYFFPVELTFAASAIYEVGEWIAWINFRPAEAIAFLGTQGDVWDAQKDMAVAGIGALITMAVVFAFHAKFNREFWSEISKSLRPPKKDHPLGEEEFQKLVENGK